MIVNWKDETREPYLYRNVADLGDVKLHHVRVLAGELPEQTLPMHEINLLMQGEMKLVRKNGATGQQIARREVCGAVCVTPAGQTFSSEWHDQLETVPILIDPNFLARIAEDANFSKNFDFIDENTGPDSLLQHLAMELLRESNEKIGGKLYVDSLIQTLCLHLLKAFTTAVQKSGKKVGGLSGYILRRIEEYIEARLEDDISLGELADVANLSQYHFSRSFRKSMGETPQQFLMRRRIERAKELLAKPEIPIVEVGLQTGFKNQSHFTSLFRKNTSFTPKMWRDMRLA